jgi:hypothetical protein
LKRSRRKSLFGKRFWRPRPLLKLHGQLKRRRQLRALRLQAASRRILRTCLQH